MPDAIEGAVYRDEVFGVRYQCLSLAERDGTAIVELRPAGSTDVFAVDLEKFRAADRVEIEQRPNE